MNIFTSYNDAFRACMNTKTFAVAHLKILKKNINIDTSGCYKVFFLTTGNKWFHINNLIYETNPYEVYVISQNDWHYFSHFSEAEEHERFVFFIFPDYLSSLSSINTKLEKCFQFEPESPRKLVLSEEDKRHFLDALNEFTHPGEYGSDLMENALFMEMLIRLNRIRQREIKPADPVQIHVRSQKGKKLLEYIDSHITEDIGVQTLAEQFYFSPSYLCRFFKNTTGTTIHKYISAQRITLAKKHLAEGFPVTEVGYMCGFHDYNAFLRAFLKNVGMPPKQFAKSFSAADERKKT